MQSAGVAGLSSIDSVDRSLVEKIVREAAQQYLAKEKRAAVPSSESGSALPAAPPLSNSSSAQPLPAPNPELFFTPEAEQIKREICAVGRKLWMRQFVDGNGGNISYRIGPNEVICTPTLVSKYDLTPEMLSLVDLEGNQIAGTLPRTSEIFLHLEIYKAVPEAKSAVHCHPPHATAYAVTGRVPPNLILPEFEVFVGKVAMAPYSTPGTIEFARSVLPFVKQHNTVLLASHGIVCWADTVTHAEWYAEVLETYCWTMMLAAQLGGPISHFTEQQELDLLAMKKKLGLPDVRFDRDSQSSDREASSSPAAIASVSPETNLDGLVKSVTDAVIAALAGK